jgi:Ca2+-binding EF-hand superfamily protein
MNPDFNNIWTIIASTSVGIVITMLGFWLTFIKNIPTRSEVSDLIQNHSPYVHDRQFIMERLSINKETQMTLSVALQKVIDVMSDLKIQIATLGKTLETLEERIERSEK